MSNIRIANLQISYRRFLSDFASGILGYFFCFIVYYYISSNSDISFLTILKNINNFIKNLDISLQIILLLIAIPFGTTINALSWFFLEEIMEYFLVLIIKYEIPFFMHLDGFFRYKILLYEIFGEYFLKIIGKLEEKYESKCKIYYVLYSLIGDFLSNSIEYIDNKVNLEFARGLRIMFRNLAFLSLITFLILILAGKMCSSFLFFILFWNFLFLGVGISVYIYTSLLRTFIVLIIKEPKYKREFAKFLQLLYHYLQ